MEQGEAADWPVWRVVGAGGCGRFCGVAGVEDEKVAGILEYEGIDSHKGERIFAAV